MRGLERGQDALGPAEAWNPRERVLVGGPDVLGQARVAEVRVLGADARVVEARGIECVSATWPSASCSR